METKKVIEFYYSEECKRPRSVDSSNPLFCSYASEKITISGSKLKTVELQNKVILPPDMSALIWLMTLLTLADS